jgi:hypothetical protein
MHSDYVKILNSYESDNQDFIHLAEIPTVFAFSRHVLSRNQAPKIEVSLAC